MLEKYKIPEHVLFPKNGMPISEKWESAGLLYSMFRALGANEKSLLIYSFESIKSLLDEINEKEDRNILPDLSKLKNMDINGLIYRLKNYNIDTAVNECIKYKGGKYVGYTDLFCIVWNEQRYPKLCLLLGAK